MKARALREEQVEAERILLATQAALDEDAALLSNEERTAVDLLMIHTREILAQSQAGTVDHLAVKAAVEALAHGTEEFASRRMDRSVRSALAGRTLDQVA
jgi:molecular chaperone HscA